MYARVRESVYAVCDEREKSEDNLVVPLFQSFDELLVFLRSHAKDMTTERKKHHLLFDRRVLVHIPKTEKENEKEKSDWHPKSRIKIEAQKPVYFRREDKRREKYCLRLSRAK